MCLFIALIWSQIVRALLLNSQDFLTRSLLAEWGSALLVVGHFFVYLSALYYKPISLSYALLVPLTPVFWGFVLVAFVVHVFLRFFILRISSYVFVHS